MFNHTSRVRSSRSRMALRLGGLALAAVTAAALAACSTPAASAPDDGDETTTMNFGIQPVIAYGMFQVAQEDGFFTDSNVESTLISFDSGSPELEAMAGGSIDAGTMGATPVLIAAAAGLISDLKIVSITDNPSNGYSILSDPSITSVADLKGKTIAGTAGSNYQYFLYRALEKYGLTDADITFVNAEPADAQASFIAGRVDAIVPPESARFLIPERRPDTNVLFTAEDFTSGPGSKEPFDVFDVIVAPGAKASDPALASFLEAFHGPTVSKLRDDPDAVYSQVTTWLNSATQAGIEQDAVKNQFDVSTFYDAQEALDLMSGDRVVSSLQQQFDFLVSAGRATGKLDASTLIDTSALESVVGK